MLGFYYYLYFCFLCFILTFGFGFKFILFLFRLFCYFESSFCYFSFRSRVLVCFPSYIAIYFIMFPFSMLIYIYPAAFSSLFIFTISFHCVVPQLPPTFDQIFFRKCLFTSPYARKLMGNVGILRFLLDILCVRVRDDFLMIYVSYLDVYILYI